MAVTGAIAAQFFNLSVGWALGLIRSIYKNGDVYFDLYGLKAVDNDVSTSNTSVYAIVLIVYCSVTLMAVISFPQFTRRKLTKGFAIFLLCVYCFFVILIGYLCYLLSRSLD